MEKIQKKKLNGERQERERETVFGIEISTFGFLVLPFSQIASKFQTM
jgi:hypothetical protein